jgi:site-specific DNA-methyltransferase (adenine-specific)
MRDYSTLIHGDCLEEMKQLPDKSIDMILCDLPYGTTSCHWDQIIPMDKLWSEYSRIIKSNGCIALFGGEPFSSFLRMSNIKQYKYDLYWQKERPTNIFNLKKSFGKTVENIVIFYKKQPVYNPQKYIETRSVSNRVRNGRLPKTLATNQIQPTEYIDDGTRYPKDVLCFARDHIAKGKNLHPTQKPVKLLEYLINSYTNKGHTVLDNCMGSGSTAIACLNTGRQFIGIEKDEQYFKIAKKRILNHESILD